MSKLPAILFYTGDWLKDPQLSLCSPATRGVWMDLLCAMHEAGRSGELRGTTEQLARVARCSTADFAQALTDLQATGAASVTERNGVFTLMSRRMARENKERRAAALRQSRRRSHGSSHGDVAPPSSIASSISKNHPPQNPVENSIRPSAGLAGGGNSWNLDSEAHARLVLKASGYKRFNELIVQCRDLGLLPSDVVAACEEYEANRDRFESPGAIAEKLRSGHWPADGVVSPNEAAVKESKRKAKETASAVEALRFKLIRSGVDEARDWDEKTVVKNAKEKGFA